MKLKEYITTNCTSELRITRLVENTNFRAIYRLSFFPHTFSPKIFGFRPWQIVSHIRQRSFLKTGICTNLNVQNKNPGSENIFRASWFCFWNFWVGYFCGKSHRSIYSSLKPKRIQNYAWKWSNTTIEFQEIYWRKTKNATSSRFWTMIL